MAEIKIESKTESKEENDCCGFKTNNQDFAIQELSTLDEKIKIGSHGAYPTPSENTQFSSETFCARGYTPFDPKTGAINTPIYLSSTFAHTELGLSTGFDYGRCLNPTRLELERTVAVLEHCSYSLAFSSGMAAISCLARIFNSGDEVIISNDLYGGTYRLFSIYEKYGIKTHYVDTSNLEEVNNALTQNTRAIFIETPSNPTMKVTDIKACSELIHKNRSDGILIVDNTFLSPYFQNPHDFGADIIIHSGTKHLGGHHDALAGFLVYDTKEFDDFFRYIQISEGAVLSPFDAYLLLRGIKTLSVRLEKAQSNAEKIADFLSNCPQVEQVYYPTLLQENEKAIFKNQSRGNGSMISFAVKDEHKVPQILKNLKLILFAESLGGVQSLITYPIAQTHNSIPEEMRNKVGVNKKLLRLSIGIENADELINDLKNVLYL